MAHMYRGRAERRRRIRALRDRGLLPRGLERRRLRLLRNARRGLPPTGERCALCLWDGPVDESYLPGWEHDGVLNLPRWEDRLYATPCLWVVRIRRALVGHLCEFKICPPCAIENQRIQNIRDESYELYEDESWYYVVYAYRPSRLVEYEREKDCMPFFSGF